MFENTPTVLTLINWLTDPQNAVLLVAIFAAISLEKVQGWHELGRETKLSIIMIGSAVVGLVGYYTNILYMDPANAEIVAKIEELARPVLYIMTAWIASQITHLTAKGNDLLIGLGIASEEEVEQLE